MQRKTTISNIKDLMFFNKMNKTTTTKQQKMLIDDSICLVNARLA